MELRAVQLAFGTFNLQGYQDTGTQVKRFFGRIGSLAQCAGDAAILVGASNGGMSYNASDHDPFPAD